LERRKQSIMGKRVGRNLLSESWGIFTYARKGKRGGGDYTKGILL